MKFDIFYCSFQAIMRFVKISEVALKLCSGVYFKYFYIDFDEIPYKIIPCSAVEQL
jgi:hypothetical protein